MQNSEQNQLMKQQKFLKYQIFEKCLKNTAENVFWENALFWERKDGHAQGEVSTTKGRRGWLDEGHTGELLEQKTSTTAGAGLLARHFAAIRATKENTKTKDSTKQQLGSFTRILPGMVNNS